MNIFAAISIFITLAALIGFLNTKFFQLPTTIAIMSGSLLLSIFLIGIDHLGFHDIAQYVENFIAQLDFHKLLMEGMLSFLLFAGALNVDLHYLDKRKWEIATLASLGTLTSTFLLATSIYYLLPLMGLPMPYIYCLLFGALISPTDPIAVLAIFKQVNTPKTLEITVAGESLFNDGVGIVVFLTLYQVAFSGVPATWGSVSILFLQQAVGGIAYGIALGLTGYWLLKQIDDYKVEILITLSMASGGYLLSELIHVSGPLAMVVAGIFLGNRGRRFSMSKETQENLDTFWELVDEILNAVLFLIMGFEILILGFNILHVYAGLLAIPLVLLIRFITVGTPMSIFKRYKTYEKNFIKVVVWGGLRGGLAVALALYIPAGPYRDLILTMTYSVVIFSVIVQGLTIKGLVQVSKEG